MWCACGVGVDVGVDVVVGGDGGGVVALLLRTVVLTKHLLLLPSFSSSFNCSAHI